VESITGSMVRTSGDNGTAIFIILLPILPICLHRASGGELSLANFDFW
jgi:hypothetical protein